MTGLLTLLAGAVAGFLTDRGLLVWEAHRKPSEAELYERMTRALGHSQPTDEE